ncbi:FtsX-like permease family protein [Dactylosporangium sp. NPDC050688]|uniref:ABC transporter permease n=1 Tax=Dactylosporangium sp. NPDC050688 TaxID=3157217 RepID=UPI0033F0F65A
MLRVGQGRRSAPLRTARRFGGAFVAVAVGIALLTAATLLFASGRALVPDRLAGAAVIVRSPAATSPADPFTPPVPWSSRAAADLAARIAALPGVTAAVPDRTFYVQAVIDGRPFPAGGERQDAREGHGWSSARLGGLRLAAGAAPRGPGEVVVDRALGLSPGDPVTLLTGAGPASYTVSGTVDAPGFHVTDEAAEALAPGVDTIGVLLDPGADRGAVAAAVQAVAGGGRVLTGDARSALEPRDDARTRWIGMQVLTAVAALAGFVTVFVVASTFAFAVAQRRREFGLLRAVGATPRQVRRMVQGEALAVGAAGSVAGLLAGAACAPPLGWALVDAGFEPSTFRVRFVLWPVVAALTAGPLVALAGAWSAARRAARVRPVEALREAAVEQRPMGRARWIAGLALVAAGVALAVGTATSGSAQDSASFALYGAMALVTGVTALAPVVVRPLVWLLRSPLRSRGGAIGMLVRGSALTAARRTASTAAPVLLTVTFAVLVSGTVRTSTGAYAVGRSARVDAGWVVAPDRAPGLSDAATVALPGAAVLPTTVFTAAGGAVPGNAVGGGGAPRAWVGLGVEVDAFVAVSRRLEVRSGAVTGLRGDDTVVLTESTAAAARAAAPVVSPASPNVSPGVSPAVSPAVFPVVFADGTVAALRVVAVVADASVPGDLVLPRGVVRAHDPSALTSAVFVRDRVDVPAGAGARVVDVATWAAEQDSAEDRLVWLFTVLLIAVSAGYGAIAVANTLLMAAGGRVVDLRAVRLAGATRRQVLRLVTAESALVVLIGAVLGGVVALAALLSIRAGLSEQVGAPVELVVPWPVAAGVVGLCLLLAVTASAVPAARFLRAAPPHEPG